MTEDTQTSRRSSNDGRYAHKKSDNHKKYDNQEKQ
jgi:hypothetical protein